MDINNDTIIKPIGYFQLLRQNRNFRYLWVGEVISYLGDWFNIVAILALTLSLTNSAQSASWIFIIRMIPFFIMSPIAGVVADRFNRKTIMILSDLARAAVVLSFILVQRADQIWIIYVANFVEITLSSFFSPAKSAVIPNIVAKDELISANALSAITWSAMLTIGAVIGGFASALFGHNTAFVINSISFLLSAYLIWKVQMPEETDIQSKQEIAMTHPIKQYLDGLRYLKHKKDALAYVCVKSGWGISGGIILLITIFGQRVFPIGGNADAGIGVLYSARGLGTAIGPIVARKICGNSQKEMRNWIGYSFLIGGIFFIGFGFSNSLWLACLFLFLSHTGTSIMWVFSTTLLQLNTEDKVRGRVFATEWALFTLAIAISNYLTGVGIDIQWISLQHMIMLLGGLIFFPGILWLILLSKWNKWIEKKS